MLSVISIRARHFEHIDFVFSHEVPRPFDRGRARMTNFILAAAALLCLAIALIQSWLIVAALSNAEGAIGRLFPNTRELIRSHVDYLMMTQFLFIFYGLFRSMGLIAPAWLILLVAFGSFFNPFAFFVRAIKPSYIASPAFPFRILLTVSCAATTIGYAIAGFIIVQAAWNNI
ncbi:MAG: hypothetical protein ACLP8A_05430 [Methylovirgula sp.]